MAIKRWKEKDKLQIHSDIMLAIQRELEVDPDPDQLHKWFSLLGRVAELDFYSDDYYDKVDK